MNLLFIKTWKSLVHCTLCHIIQLVFCYAVARPFNSHITIVIWVLHHRYLNETIKVFLHSGIFWWVNILETLHLNEIIFVYNVLFTFMCIHGVFIFIVNHEGNIKENTQTLNLVLWAGIRPSYFSTIVLLVVLNIWQFLFILKKIKNPKPIKEITKLIILIMTSAQDIKLGINDQLRLMTQCLESLNFRKMLCTLIVFGLLKLGCRRCQKKKIKKIFPNTMETNMNREQRYFICIILQSQHR